MGEEMKIATGEIDVNGRETFKLVKPVKVDGKDVTEITLNLEGLTGEDILAAENMMEALGYKVGTAHELSKPYLMCLGARAAKMIPEDLMRFSAADVTRITLLTQGFLLKGV